jgi:alpha-ketoglutarate-dependent taurine dioxygenase
VARLAGVIHETNYGRLFDVRSEPNPNNLANTDWGLGLHTDNPYRDPVPGFQILHCLQASAEGAESVFADGFALAQCLKKEDWVAFLVLASTPARFRFQDATADLSAERPLLELNLKGELAAVHCNNRSIAPLSLAPNRMRSFMLLIANWQN